MGRKKKQDGRTVLGMRRALESALEDESRDSRLVDMLNQDMRYTAIAAEIGVSRQRATELTQRAIIRKAMLIEHRAGKPLEDLSIDWSKLYPQSKRGRGGKRSHENGGVDDSGPRPGGGASDDHAGVRSEEVRQEGQGENDA